MCPLAGAGSCGSQPQPDQRADRRGPRETISRPTGQLPPAIVAGAARTWTEQDDTDAHGPGSASTTQAGRFVTERAADRTKPATAGSGAGAPSGRAARRRRFGTASRLALLHGLVIAIVLGVVVAQIVNSLASQLVITTTNDLKEDVTEFVDAAAVRPAGQDLSTFAQQYLATRVPPSRHLLVLLVPGKEPIASAGAGAVLSPSVLQPWISRPPSASIVQQLRLGSVDYGVMAAPVRLDSGPVATFVVATSLAAIEAEDQRVALLAVGEAAVAVIAGVLSVYLLLRRVLRTVGRISATAQEIGSGDLERRLGDQGTDDEVGRLAATFDAMLERISAAMTAQRRLLADVSHQLRTPLTVARGHLEVLARGPAEDPVEVRQTVSLVVDELDHMRTLVERLLLLGHAMEPDFIVAEPIDLRSFLADVVEAGRVLAPRAWQLGSVPDVVVLGDPSKLRGALLNLIDNAATATGPGDEILVTAGAAAQGGLAIAVEDSGPGIAPERRAAVLARFARLGPADSLEGGLGLAIVQAVAEGHGGRIELGDSPLGGCRVTIVLPAGRVERPRASGTTGA